MDALTRLEAIEDIRTLKARYFRAIDTKDWGTLPRLVTDDMRVVTPAGETYAEGGGAFVAGLRASLEHSVSQHRGFSHEIEITGLHDARGIFAMEDVIRWSEPHRHPREGWKAIVGRGHYHDGFRRGADGAWRIATLCLVRLSLDVER